MALGTGLDEPDLFQLQLLGFIKTYRNPLIMQINFAEMRIEAARNKAQQKSSISNQHIPPSRTPDGF